MDKKKGLTLLFTGARSHMHGVHLDAMDDHYVSWVVACCWVFLENDVGMEDVVVLVHNHILQRHWVPNRHCGGIKVTQNIGYVSSIVIIACIELALTETCQWDPPGISG
jgi:hypothetical protein